MSSQSSQEEQARKALKPICSFNEARNILKSSWNITNVTKLSALESYDDINISAVCEDWGVTRKFTLKIHNGVDSTNQPLLDAQNKMMSHLGRNGCVCPQPIQPAETTKDCRDAQTSNIYASDITQAAITFKILPTLKGGQTPLAVRLLTWVHGVTMSEVGGNESTLEAAGAFLGSMATALLSFDHPALHREHAWDIRRTLAIREFIPHIIDERRRSLVLTVLRAFESEVLPYDASLPRAVIMGDFNDANIILNSMSTAERPRISGVIDFGDAVHTWRINELAIGMAYSMLGSWGKQDGYHLRAAQAFFRGYCSSSTSPQLDPTEIRLLPVLTACRLATSYTFGMYSYSQDPSNEYLLLHATPAGRALEVWFEETERSHLLSFLLKE